MLYTGETSEFIFNDRDRAAADLPECVAIDDAALALAAIYEALTECYEEILSTESFEISAEKKDKALDDLISKGNTLMRMERILEAVVDLDAPALDDLSVDWTKVNVSN